MRVFRLLWIVFFVGLVSDVMAQPSHSFDGLWRSQGYGFVVSN